MGVSRIAGKRGIDYARRPLRQSGELMNKIGKNDNGRSAIPTRRVWDFPTRAFHWLLASLVGWEWASAHLGGNAMTYHIWGGYAVLTLIIFRVFWGFIGSTTARFSSFLRSPKEIGRYLMALKTGGYKGGPGHNPLGGLAVAAFLLSLAVQVGTGLFATDDILTAGPLNPLVSNRTADFLTLIHKTNFDILLGLVAVHVTAILLHKILGGKNLVTPMITGRAPASDHSELKGSLVFSRAWLGAVALGLSAVITWLIVRL